MEDGDIQGQLKRLAEKARESLGLTEDDLLLLRRVKARAGELDALLERAVSQLAGNPEAGRALARMGLSRADVERLLRGWLRDLFEGGYDWRHAGRIAEIGLRHVKLPAAGSLIVSTFGVFLRELVGLAGSLEEAEALVKAMLWNLMVVTFVYEKVREEMYRYFVGDKDVLVERLVGLFSREMEKKLGE